MVVGEDLPLAGVEDVRELRGDRERALQELLADADVQVVREARGELRIVLRRVQEILQVDVHPLDRAEIEADVAVVDPAAVRDVPFPDVAHRTEIIGVRAECRRHPFPRVGLHAQVQPRLGLRGGVDVGHQQDVALETGHLRDVVVDVVAVNADVHGPFRHLELVEQLRIVGGLGLEVHGALLEVVRVDHAHVGVELRIRGPRDAPRIGQRQTVLLGNLVLERQRRSEEEMLRPLVQNLFLTMQMRAAVFGTETGAPGETVAPLRRGELHVGGGHVLPV